MLLRTQNALIFLSYLSVNELKPSDLKELRVLGEGAFATVKMCELRVNDASSPKGAQPQLVALKCLKPVSLRVSNC